MPLSESKLSALETLEMLLLLLLPLVTPGLVTHSLAVTAEDVYKQEVGYHPARFRRSEGQQLCIIHCPFP